MDEPFQQRLDALLEQSKTLSDGDYFAQVEHICAAREVAKRQLLLELSREANSTPRPMNETARREAGCSLGQDDQRRRNSGSGSSVAAW
jgi:hypothetical protein